MSDILTYTKDSTVHSGPHLPAGYLVATFADGFVIEEDENDQSAFSEGHNVFHDLVNKLHEPEHGPLTEFSLITTEGKYTVDFASLPENAEPVRYLAKQTHITPNGVVGPFLRQIRFGYQYEDDEGNNVADIADIFFD
jgi:hypothetical protein